MIQYLGQLELHYHQFNYKLAIINLLRKDRTVSLNIGDKIPEFELFNYDKTKPVSYTHLRAHETR